MNRYTIIFIFIAFASIEARAQNFLSWRYSDRYFSLAIGTGNSYYIGELNTANNVQKDLSNFSLGLEARLLSRVSARIEGSYFSLHSGDNQADKGSFEYQRNLSFESKNAEVALEGVFFIREYGGDYFRRWRIDPYFTLGLGYTFYNPQTTFNNTTYELRPLKLEGVAYKKGTLIVPASLGIKLKVNPFVNFNLEVAYRYTFTDYLDDVSGTYQEFDQSDIRFLLANRKNEIDVVNPAAYEQLVPGNLRGDDRKNDQYLFFGYRLEFFIPSRSKEPVLKKPSAY